MDKWTEKDVLEYAKKLKSPFEQQNGQGKKFGLAEKIRELANRNKGIK